MVKDSTAVVLSVVAACAALAVGVVMTVPAARRALRPVLKSGIKNLVAASIAIRRQVAELGEEWDDLMAEAGEEMAGAKTASPTATQESQEAKAETVAPRKRRARKTA